MSTKSKVVPYVVVVTDPDQNDDDCADESTHFWTAIIAAVLLAMFLIPALDTRSCPVPTTSNRVVLQMP